MFQPLFHLIRDILFEKIVICITGRKYTMKMIYLDHAATTPLHPAVIEQMIAVMTNFYGNPSSIHQFGRAARKVVDKARRVISQEINAKPQEIIFTGSGTEGNNTAIRSAVKTQQRFGNHIITSKIEHPAVLETCRQLENDGFRVTYLPVDKNGFVSVSDVENALTNETILVSIMTVNNETGAIQPIKEIGELLADHQALFHTDAVQGFGRVPFDVAQYHIDFLTASAHKLNGPKGVGLLYVKQGTPFSPLLLGGKQERARRASTENVISIAGFGKAVEVNQLERTNYHNNEHLCREAVMKELEHVEHWQNTVLEQSTSHILNISFPNVCLETLMTSLDLAGIAISSGSACSAGSHEPSHVLLAMFGTNERSGNNIRISFGLDNSVEEVQAAARKMKELVAKLQK